MDLTLFIKCKRIIEQSYQIVLSLLRPFLPPIVMTVIDIHIDSPLILLFAALCCGIRYYDTKYSNISMLYFGVLSSETYQFNQLFRFHDLMSYWRILSHVMGHASWSHMNNNMLYILLVGSHCENEYGSWNLFKIMAITAYVTGICHLFFGSRNTVQLGASGIVFMLIILSSLTQKKGNKTPLTFIIQVGIWLYSEVVAELLIIQGKSTDKISHIAHIFGAIVGAVAGYYLHGERVHKRMAPMMLSWYKHSKKQKDHK